jgi:predicted CXXCH cytochrome family protein
MWRRERVVRRLSDRRGRRRRCGVWLAVGLLWAPTVVSAQTAQGPNGCASCHADLTDERLREPVRRFAEDVHRARGFGCVDCHGGDPTTMDKTRAKAAARGYRGRPQGEAIVTTCARCHSDAEFMRRFVPRQRVDQATEYWTSVHGQKLKQGDDKVATCTSCHEAHGIRQVNDARSPVFPLNVAATCGRCHADPEYMKGRTLPSGAPMPITQVADYERSAHYLALTRGRDLASPTCNDCHGNHGAAPPGVDAVVNVCGTCHGVFADRFARSVHREIFERGCVECHGNHAIAPSSDALLGTGREALCVVCHSEGDKGYEAAAAMRTTIDDLKHRIETVRALVNRAAGAGMEMSAQQLALSEATNRLVLLRTEIHAADPAALDPIAREGQRIVSQVEEAARAALAELAFRRRGLVISLGAILLMVVALALKIRELDRRAGLRP